MSELIVSSFLADLHEHCGYPKEILDFDYKNNLEMQLNNSVWDIENGVVLRLDPKTPKPRGNFININKMSSK